MFSSKLKAGILAIAMATGAGAAQATTITFDEFPANETAFLSGGDSFATGGYNFNISSGLVFFISRTGTTSMDLGGTLSVTNAANKVFSLASLDLRTVLPLETSSVKLTGTDVSGHKTIQTYTNSGASRPNPNDLTTHYLTGFDNLTSLVMELVYNESSFTNFSLVDNLVLNEQPAAAVPEPETWAMLGVGLAMVAGMSRRKRA
ncbi:PEP-CTERM sorting domain-containing protein [Oxalobacteraceae bacterium OTU3CINTB1]|nr:PEP-CTERM sorting domain-containing protein [Oxalobacteraceae bacterium OTU3CINTB1]